MARIMKRILLPLLAITLVLIAPSNVAAETPNQFDDLTSLFRLKTIGAPIAPSFVPAETNQQVKPKKKNPVVYTVASGDNLTKIGTKYNVEWQRLWAKNKQLKHPDLIHLGDKITIPEPSERLKRQIPATVSLPDKTPNVVPLRSYGGVNTYDYGYCTWYVKNRRGASLPNNLGDANTWYSRAAAMGMAVGSTPKPGAVGTTTAGAWGHVVYVEKVLGNGKVLISEMNYKGFAVQSTRTVSASEFLYIY